jgi:hypothetical protein
MEVRASGNLKRICRRRAGDWSSGTVTAVIHVLGGKTDAVTLGRGSGRGNGGGGGGSGGDDGGGGYEHWEGESGGGEAEAEAETGMEADVGRMEDTRTGGKKDHARQGKSEGWGERMGKEWFR